MTSQSLSSPLITIKNELLHGAVVKGELPTVRRLLDRHKADIRTKNSNGLTVLQLALLNGHTKLSEYLIQKGVDIHSSDAEGFTALHDAALVEDFTLVRKLISKGLSPLLTTNMGELVIDLAGSLPMEKLLCDEMSQAGELELANAYYTYLGLDHEVSEKMGSFDKRARSFHSHYPRNQHTHQGNHKIGPTHVSSPKLDTNKVKTQSEVSKNLTTCASRVHPSVSKSAELAQHVPLTLINSSTNYPIGGHCHRDARNHNNAKDLEVFKGPIEIYKEPRSDCAGETRPANYNCPAVSGGEVFVTDKDSNLIEKEPSPPKLHSDSQPSGNPTQPPAHESDHKECNSTPLSKEAIAIKSLYQHTSFQLQIGLSLHSEISESSLDGEVPLSNSSRSQSRTSGAISLSDCTDSSLSSTNSKFAATSSSSIVSCNKNLPNYRNRSKNRKESTPIIRTSSLRQERYRPLQKSVSFADFPMTHSKAMFVGRSSSTSTVTPSKEEEDVATQKVSASNTTTCSSSRSGNGTNNSSSSSAGRTRTRVMDHRIVLPAVFIDQFIKKQEIKRAERAKSIAIDGMFDAGIRALSLKPRKSIISYPNRRNTISNLSRRRSVTFQPEVLLQEIVTDGDVKAVSEILESGVIEDVNKMSPSGLTALHQSAIDGNLECAKALVAKGADFNCTDCEGWTPLHAAVMNGCLVFVRFLLASGANPALKNDAGETAYDMAKSRPIRKMLLHAMNGKSLDANDFSDGEYSGEEEEEYSHAESESDDDMEGEGSGLFDSNVEGKNSLKERLGLTHTSALNNLLGDSTSPSPDLDSVFSSNSHVKFHNRDRELTDSTSSYGSLFEAETEDIKSEVMKRPQTKTFESDTDKISESGISTMEGSSDCSHRSLILSSKDELITLDCDLDPDSLDYKFQEACLYCDVDMVLKLVKYKCEIDVNRVNQTSGITALHHSVLEENFAVVQYLVKDFEADLHVIDIDGWTPLHAASAVGNIRIAQFLLDRGAKASCLNNQCEFPVDVAEDEAMEKLLKNAMLGHSSGSSLKR